MQPLSDTLFIGAAKTRDKSVNNSIKRQRKTTFSMFVPTRERVIPTLYFNDTTLLILHAGAMGKHSHRLHHGVFWQIPFIVKAVFSI